MIYKAFGALLLFCVSGISGFTIAKHGRQKIMCLTELSRALIILKNEIKYHKSGLAESFFNISQKTVQPVKGMMENLSNELSKRKLGAGLIWENEINTNDELMLDNEQKLTLASFGKALGYLDLKAQIDSIDFILTYLEKETQVLEKRQIEDGKLYKSLGIIFGLLLAVLVI